PPETKVKLYRRPFPYKAAHLMTTLAPSGTGAFYYKTAPNRNTRYVARPTGTSSASATVKVGVFGGLKIKVQALPLGRGGITIILHHPADLHWSGTKARWYFKTNAHATFYEAPSTTTQRLNARTTEIHKV